MTDCGEIVDKLLQAVYEGANFMSRVGVQDRLGQSHYMILLRTRWGLAFSGEGWAIEEIVVEPHGKS